jgi:hypothetical protein
MTYQSSGTYVMQKFVMIQNKDRLKGEIVSGKANGVN